MTALFLLLAAVAQADADTRRLPSDWGQPVVPQAPQEASPGRYALSQADSFRWRELARTGQVHLAIAEINLAVDDRETRRRYIKLATMAYRDERQRRVRSNGAERARRRRRRLAEQHDPLAALARYQSYRSAPAGYSDASCSRRRVDYIPYGRAPYDARPYRPAEPTRSYLARQ
ncbi:MAG: hypothetical protein ACC628_10055 [Pirellulaceae bacterium]